MRGSAPPNMHPLILSVALGTQPQYPPGKTRRPQIVHSKRHVPKAMFLTALARPRFDADGNCVFDGKIAIERVCSLHTAKRDSKHHKKGDQYEKDINMNGAVYIKMMKTQIFPAIIEAFKDCPGVHEVRVQQDGARSHTAKRKDGTERYTVELNAHGATLKPKIRIITQPAQSPDTNVCDLAFFRALDSAVRKTRRLPGDASHNELFDLDKLSTDVHAAFEAYDPDTLEKMWVYKSIVMDRVIASKGGNDYSRHGNAEEKRAFTQEVTEVFGSE